MDIHKQAEIKALQKIAEEKIEKQVREKYQSMSLEKVVQKLDELKGVKFAEVKTSRRKV